MTLLQTGQPVETVNQSGLAHKNNGITGQPKIKANHFSFYYNYGAFKALDDINVVIPSRKITALIGSSGCGKSTFLRAWGLW